MMQFPVLLPLLVPGCDRSREPSYITFMWWPLSRGMALFCLLDLADPVLPTCTDGADWPSWDTPYKPASLLESVSACLKPTNQNSPWETCLASEPLSLFLRSIGVQPSGTPETLNDCKTIIASIHASPSHWKSTFHTENPKLKPAITRILGKYPCRYHHNQDKENLHDPPKKSLVM